MKKIFLAVLVLLAGLLCPDNICAQNAQFSIQGILKKADGKAVDNGTQSLKFTLYDAPVGGTQVWTETQTGVDVVGGIYSVSLGSVNALNVSFNQPYYLGVTVGTGTEMSPRMRLTSAPYALSLIGQTNQFPSTGQVKADYIVVPGGAPASGTAAKGYSFTGINCDTDGGLFSSGDGVVSLYTNAAERLRAATGGVEIFGKLSLGTFFSNTHSVSVNGGYLARGGAPGNGGDGNNGYSFQTAKTNGVFSNSDNEVNIYCGGSEMIRAHNYPNSVVGINLYGNVAMTGKVFTNSISDGAGAAVQLSNGELVKVTSSARYKENIADLKRNFGALLLARPKEYTRKTRPGALEIGFIAEEFEALGLKDLVFYDNNGRVDGISYEKIAVYLVPLLREQSEIVAAQTAQISTLEAENAELRKQFSSLRADVDALKSQR